MGNRGPNIQRKGELKLKKHNIQHPPYGIFIFLYSISPPIEQSLGQRKETGHNTFTLLFAPLFIFFSPVAVRAEVCAGIQQVRCHVHFILPAVLLQTAWELLFRAICPLPQLSTQQRQQQQQQHRPQKKKLSTLSPFGLLFILPFREQRSPQE